MDLLVRWSYVLFLCFFFFKQKTAYEMRISDWSSDVCSSDLIERITDEADAVVLPYRDIVNSGSALLALSRFRPVIAPRLGSLIELQGQVGEDWLWLYDGPLTGERMREGIE